MVHIVSGFSALVCAWYLAPGGAALRAGDASVTAHIDAETIEGPANVPIVLLGTSLVFFGFFGVGRVWGWGSGLVSGVR